ncbi:MAG: pilus assembly protein TadG-related protein, partial [Burkholderiales bacterium]|nr:pilus assembly protein TadG-related protein [Burkholderiales bacterium]
MHTRQRGQALAFIGVTTVVVLLGLLLLYNVAQITTQKMKLQNTADAAAYSGALTEARDYNFTAYANRAMIANQVAVAQVVGLRSWARNLDSVYKSGPFTWVPDTFASLSALSAMWTTVWNVVRTAAGGIESVMNAIAGPLVTVLDLLIDALYYGSTAYHIAMILTVPETVIEVIEKNDPNASLSTSLTQIGFAAKHALDVYDFTSDYDPTKSGNDDNKSGSSKDRQANVIFNSQDGFYNFRSYPWPLPILIDPTKAIPGNFGTMFMIMYHSGGTELKNKSGTYMKSWTGADATGLFTILMVWIFVPFPVPIPIPIPTPQGYGAALAGSNNDLQPASGNFNHNFAQAYGSTFVNPLTMVPGWINVGNGT